MNYLCVFCGSRTGQRPVYAEAARAVGAALVQHGLGLVYGGGNIGLMGLLADAVLARDGQVIGVIPQEMVGRELAHHNLTRLHVVQTMHERKALMAELSSAFLALPGGFGTWDELCEILTWAQLGYHRKPIGLLNTAGFYDAFLAQLQQAVADGFVTPENQGLLRVGSDADALIRALQVGKPG